MDSKLEVDTIREMEERRYNHSRDQLGDAIALYGLILETYYILNHAINSNGTAWVGKSRPLHLLVSACQYNFTMAIMSLLRGHRSDSFYHVRSAVEYSGVARLMREEPDLEALWDEARLSRQKLQDYKHRTTTRRLFPKDNEKAQALYGRYDEASTRIHSSGLSVEGNVKALDDEHAAFIYFDVDKNNPTTLFEPYVWINETHYLILYLFEDVFADELMTFVGEWARAFICVGNNYFCARRELLGHDVSGIVEQIIGVRQARL